MTLTSERALAVVLAGGRSRRFGSPKAQATVDGRPLLGHALATLDAVAPAAVIVANEPLGPAGDRREVRPDVRPGSGVLGGLLTAVEWARDAGREAAVVLACDMPFVPPALLARLLGLAGPEVACVPESHGPRGLEPLCAVYGVGCAAAMAGALDRGDRAVISFFSDIEVRRLPLSAVEFFGDPERLFFNVNRPEERDTAERLARRSSRTDPGESIE